MTPRFFPRTAFALGFCAAGALLSVPAAAYDAEYVFGDSLSDNGNLAALFGTTFPNPPSYSNSFTNGSSRFSCWRRASTSARILPSGRPCPAPPRERTTLSAEPHPRRIRLAARP